jgi:23S rRNA (uracil1939-C5)-methyltransferase
MVNLVTREDRPDIMQELTEILRADFPAVTTICNNITERKSQVAVGDREVIYFGPGYLTERLGGRFYRVSANSFFQTNTRQAERLYDTVRRLAGFRPDDVVYDLYAGTGTIGLHVADDVRLVVGVESAAAAVEDARRNAKNSGAGNCTFVHGDLRETLLAQSSFSAMHGRPDVILIDPPRAGMHEDVVNGVLALMPRTIVYVSCNPSTQARDLAKLCTSYRIVEVQPVDMFPQTFHIENVVALFR